MNSLTVIFVKIIKSFEKNYIDEITLHKSDSVLEHLSNPKSIIKVRLKDIDVASKGTVIIIIIIIIIIIMIIIIIIIKIWTLFT